MSGRIFHKLLIALTVFSALSIEAGAQTFGQYSPYSLYGIGELSQPGTAYNKTMGGVGLASRDNRFLNILNPAAVTARDSLAVMMDFSVYVDNKIFQQQKMRNAFNTANIGSLAMSFPIWRSSAMMFGITPYSGTGYGYSFSYTDPSLLGKVGNVDYSATGQGAIYQTFAAAGVTFFNRISLGAQFNFLFGKIDKSATTTFSNSKYSGIYHGQSVIINGFGGKFGLQYEQPIGKGNVLCLGATYNMSTKMRGFLDDLTYSTGTVVDTLKIVSDTVTFSNSKLNLASEIGVGLSFRRTDRWMVEFDYTLADWRKAGFDNYPILRGNSNSAEGISSFQPSIAHTFRLGFEFVPNRNDIRYYFNKVAYRGGLYYKRDYFKVDGHNINAYGFTLGLSLPINKRYNGVNVGLEFGRRGSIANNLIMENYMNFSVGVSLFDIWFEKPKYR